jgi:hypothetical protein
MQVAQLVARIAFHNSTAIAPCDRLRPDPAADPRRHMHSTAMGIA